MEVKKKDKVNLERYKGIFLQVGFILALGAVLAAFEWTTSPREVDRLEVEVIVEDEESTPITTQEELKEPPPPPPPQVADELNLAPDDVELEEEMDIENMEIDDDTQIEKVEIEKEEVEETVFFVVEEMPKFPGGELALRKFIAQNTEYPAMARENNIQGKVYVRFMVAEDGSVSRVTVVRSVHPLLDKEAMRVVSLLPKWKPGKQRNKPVKVWYTVPINFQLQ